MLNKIIHHEDWQESNYIQFLTQYWGKTQRRPLPPVNAVKGDVQAEINQGRWVAECPNGCGNAVVVSEQTPIYICYECGGETWYKVKFPKDKVAIETELIKRPADNPFHALNRNWKRGETVTDLKRENAERRIR